MNNLVTANESIIVDTNDFLYIQGAFYIIINNGELLISVPNITKSIYYWHKETNKIRLYTEEVITDGLLETIRIFKCVNQHIVNLRMDNSWTLPDFEFPENNLIFYCNFYKSIYRKVN